MVDIATRGSSPKKKQIHKKYTTNAVGNNTQTRLNGLTDLRRLNQHTTKARSGRCDDAHFVAFSFTLARNLHAESKAKEAEETGCGAADSANSASKR